ncbi:MAG: hypothetical protein LBD45_08955 [Bacteroidales bacterium]|jgi:hypothetical protein|nr:hypothetical protein [Bacteroidales bacterium]
MKELVSNLNQLFADFSKDAELQIRIICYYLVEIDEKLTNKSFFRPFDFN